VENFKDYLYYHATSFGFDSANGYVPFLAKTGVPDVSLDIDGVRLRLVGRTEVQIASKRQRFSARAVQWPVGENHDTISALLRTTPTICVYVGEAPIATLLTQTYVDYAGRMCGSVPSVWIYADAREPDCLSGVTISLPFTWLEYLTPKPLVPACEPIEISLVVRPADRCTYERNPSTEI